MNKTLIMLTLLTGCATQPALTPEQHAAAIDPLLCKDKAECDYYWQRAQSYVANYCHWRIQTSNETLIQTYGPDTDAWFAYTVVKELHRDGTARITFNPVCGNMFGCGDRVMEAYKFKYYVKQ